MISTVRSQSRRVSEQVEQFLAYHHAVIELAISDFSV